MPRRAAAILLASLAAALLHAHDARAQQVSLAATRNLDFGRFVAGAGGTVVVGATGLRSKSGAVILLNSPTSGQAQFTVSSNGGGNGNKSVVISLPADGSVRLVSGGASMAVNAFVDSPGSLATIPAGGTTLSVGATLSVSANQAPGTYTGSFPLIVNYQ
jgi:hypothetical protein